MFRKEINEIFYLHISKITIIFAADFENKHQKYHYYELLIG